MRAFSTSHDVYRTAAVPSDEDEVFAQDPMRWRRRLGVAFGVFGLALLLVEVPILFIVPSTPTSLWSTWFFVGTLQALLSAASADAQ